MPRLVGVVAVLVAAMIGCNNERLTGVEGLGFSASAMLAPPPAGRVTYAASVTNITSSSISVSLGCPTVMVFHTGSYGGVVVYDPRPGIDCIPTTQTKTLMPAEALTFSGADAPHLGAGTYYVTVDMPINGSVRSVPAGTVTF